MAISPGYLFEFEVLCMEISMALSRNFEKIDCCIAWSKQYFSYIDGKRRFECFIDQEKFQNKVWHYWNMDLTETKKTWTFKNIFLHQLIFYVILGQINLCYFNSSVCQKNSHDYGSQNNNPLGGGDCHKGHTCMFDD